MCYVGASRGGAEGAERQGGAETRHGVGGMRGLSLLLAGVLIAAPGIATAFDHRDGPAVTADPATDITDLFAWMSADATTLNMVMTVFPSADTFSKFSGSAAYVFHTSSRNAFGDSPASTVDVICTFASGAAQATSCWAGTQDYVTGDASQPSGLASTSGHLQVFAGLRDDPAFVNVAGYQNFQSAIVAASPLSLDAAGCPGLSLPTSSTLVSFLHLDGTASSAGSDAFLGQNVLALVVSVDVALLNGGGPIVSVWGSTNQL